MKTLNIIAGIGYLAGGLLMLWGAYVLGRTNSDRKHIQAAFIAAIPAAISSTSAPTTDGSDAAPLAGSGGAPDAGVAADPASAGQAQAGEG